MNFTLAELSVIKLEPGDVLSVKLYGDDYDDVDLKGLQNQLQTTFPNNKVMMFVLPNGNDLQMEKLSAKLEDSENKPVSEVEQLVEKLNDCSKPASYCNDCSCGKKEMLESKND